LFAIFEALNLLIVVKAFVHYCSGRCRLSRKIKVFVEKFHFLEGDDGDEVLDEGVGDSVARVFAIVVDCDEDDTVSDLWTIC
jgi:hypothetical protein